MNTPNHGYNTPGKGMEDWHIPLNYNFDQLDTDVEIRGPEKNKGEYEPKDGAKYEATDSGAVYYGNGTSWVLADRKVDSFGANKINGIKVPDGNDIDAFREAAEGGGIVRLRPDVTYKWDETFTFETTSDDVNNDLRVEAHHATIEHTSDPAIQTTSSEVDGQNWRLQWFGGHFYGPGRTNGNSVDPANIPSRAPDIGVGTSTFRMDDSFGHTIMPGHAEDVKAVMYVRNPDHWSEALKLGHTRTGGAYEFDCDIIFLCLGGAYLGTDGGWSMRNIQIQLDWGFGAGDIANIYQGGAGFHGGEVIHRTNVPPGGHGWYSDGNLEGTFIHFECEFGDADTTKAIEFDGTNTGPPIFRFRDPHDRIENNRPSNIFIHNEDGGFRSISGQKGFTIPFDSDEWKFESDTQIDAGSFSTNTNYNIKKHRGGHTEMRYYNGFHGDPDAPAGWYWYDGEGDVKKDHWILMSDRNTTVSPD